MRHLTPTRLVPTRSLLAAVLAGVAFATSTVSPVSAADLDYGYPDMPAALPQQTVTFGSGWYVRGDIGATDSLAIQPTSPNINTRDPSSIPVAPNLSFKKSSDVGYVASLGGGYQLNRWLRGDVVFDYNQPVTANLRGPAKRCPGDYNLLPDGTYRQGLEGCLPHYSASLSSYDVLVNGYIDLGTYWIVTPYVGAGVGMAFGHYNTSAKYTQTDGTPYDIYITNPATGATLHGNFDATNSGTYYNFAYAFMAGVAFDVYDHTKLDIGYRYLNLGSIKGISGGGSMYTNQLRVGLRYMIDN